MRQVRFRFLLTQLRFAGWRIFAKFRVQSHDFVAVFHARLGTVMEVPALTAAIGMKFVGVFNVGARWRRAFGKVSPTLWCLIFGVAHESDGKEFALHRVASISQYRGLFVQHCVAGQSQNGPRGATFGFQAFENVFPTPEHVPILVQYIQHGAASQYGYEYIRINRYAVIIERIPGFTSHCAEKLLAFKMDNDLPYIGFMVRNTFG
mmetsp:Transcript_21056/g.45779  ORF Transcript_21056/g.45779 Transcript_21056/m.45779 type:complete len:206 (+) Transcript_21056:295-912(+)